MDGSGSRNKGNAFERKISKILSKHYPGFNLRRVPSSGGLDIKCDIYDPKDDSFPLFVECKHRKSFSLQTIMGGSSELYPMFDKIERDAGLSYLCKKYKEGPVPVVIFKGGDFLMDMVAFHESHYSRIDKTTSNLLRDLNHIKAGSLKIHRLDNFLRCSDKEPLQRRAT